MRGCISGLAIFFSSSFHVSLLGPCFTFLGGPIVLTKPILGAIIRRLGQTHSARSLYKPRQLSAVALAGSPFFF